MRRSSSAGKYVRRAAVAALAAASASFVIPAVSSLGGGVASAAKKHHGNSHSTIHVGYIVPLTGDAAANGTDEENGFKLGLQHFAGANETVDGHKIDAKFLDTGGSVTTALSDGKLLISQHVTMVEGPLLANAITAVSPLVMKAGIPVDDLSMSSPRQITSYKTLGLGYTSGWNQYQVSTIGGEYAYNTMHLRHVTIMADDYAFGWEIAGGFIKEFEKLGGKIDKAIWVPKTVSDVSSYVSQIPHTTQAVYGELLGSQSLNFFKDYKQFGYKTKVPILASTTLTDQSGIADATPTATAGSFMNAQYCDDLPGKTNQQFANAYHSAYGLWPAYYSEAGYTKAEILVTALKKLKGKATTGKKLEKALRAVNIKAPRGPVTITKTFWGPVQNTYICKTIKAKTGTLRNTLVKTFKNVHLWGALTKATWQTTFAAQTTNRPST